MWKAKTLVNNVTMRTIRPPFELVPPVFGNFLCSPVQPVLISRQTDHCDRRKPLGRIGCWIAQWSQLAYTHQNLDVILREAEQFPHRRDI